MSLKSRIPETEPKDPGKIRKEILENLKSNIKKDASFFLEGVTGREEYRDKLFLMLNKIIDDSFPEELIEIDDSFIETALSEIFGLGILEKYISDPQVTDIFIQDMEMLMIKNGQKVYVGQVFKDIEDVYLLVDRIKFGSGKTVDQRMPFLNTELYDGSRCSIVIPPVSDRVYITVRVFNCLDFNLEDLLRLGMFDKDTYSLLNAQVAENKNILIAGSMGSGKTTLLNTLAKLIPSKEVINVIQDLPEIRLNNHPYARMLTTRPKSRETDNEISQDRLVFETLRMKADRIILGEVRDSMAAYQLLQALNTGHRGSFSTIHADSAYDSLIRLEMLAMEYRPNLSNEVIKKLISRAIDTVIFLEYEKDRDLNIRSRKLKELIHVDDELDQRGEYRLSYL